MDRKSSNKEFLTNLATVSHEIKTPLNMISATAKICSMMLKSGQLTIEDVSEYMQNIANNCDKIEVMINNIMSVYRISSAEYQLICVPEFVEKFAEGLKPLEKEFSFKFNYETNISNEPVKVPVSSVERILLNLITNAVKYNDKDHKSVLLTVTESKNSLLFTVKDNGNGISEDNLSKVTNLFFRAEEAKASGIGLGLSLVSQLTEAMGGKLTIDSELNKGTEVTFSIPLNVNTKLKLRDSDYIYSPSVSYFMTEFSSLRKNK